MNSIFGMFMESWILPVFCKVSETLWTCKLCKRSEVFIIPWTFRKTNSFLIFTFYYKYLKYRKNILNLGIKNVLYLKYSRYTKLTIYSERKMERRNSQLEHGQPMEQTRGLFCTSDSVVARCQSQHQYHFWRMSSVFEAYCRWVVSCQSNLCKSWGCDRLQNLKIHLRIASKM